MPATSPENGGKVNVMKTYKTNTAALLAVTVTMATISPLTLRAADTNAAPERIGIYDSRVVAYAHFSSEASQRKLKATIEAAREAKAAGQVDRFSELDAALNKAQEHIHLQVFSTAPVDDVLAEINDRLPAIQKEAGVSKLISMWDESVLKQYPKAEEVDVTDALAREFKPGESQWKVIADIKRNKPVTPDQMKNAFSSTTENVVTSPMVGHWEGNARIIMTWCRQTNLSVNLDIHADGTVSGTVGDAKLNKGRFQRNRSSLGRKLNLATDYIITGDLSGAIVAPEGITRSGVKIPLNFSGGTFTGGVNTTGLAFGGKEEMPLSAMSLTLTHSQ
jgi:hypothetical protein